MPLYYILMFNLYRNAKHRHRGGQILGILLAAVVIVGLVTMYMPVLFQ